MYIYVYILYSTIECMHEQQKHNLVIRHELGRVFVELSDRLKSTVSVWFCSLVFYVPSKLFIQAIGVVD